MSALALACCRSGRTSYAHEILVRQLRRVASLDQLDSAHLVDAHSSSKGPFYTFLRVSNASRIEVRAPLNAPSSSSVGRSVVTAITSRPDHRLTSCRICFILWFGEEFRLAASARRWRVHARA